MDWRLPAASLCTYRRCFCCSVDFSPQSLPTGARESTHARERDPLQTVLPARSPRVNFMLTHTQMCRGKRERKKREKKNKNQRIPEDPARICSDRSEVYRQVVRLFLVWRQPRQVFLVNVAFVSVCTHITLN